MIVQNFEKTIDFYKLLLYSIDVVQIFEPPNNANKYLKGVKSMFPNLNAEMARSNVSVAMIAKKIGTTDATVRRKLNGKAEFSLSECKSIRDLVAPLMGLDDLFRR